MCFCFISCVLHLCFPSTLRIFILKDTGDDRIRTSHVTNTIAQINNTNMITTAFDSVNISENADEHIVCVV